MKSGGGTVSTRSRREDGQMAEAKKGRERRRGALERRSPSMRSSRTVAQSQVPKDLQAGSSVPGALSTKPHELLSDKWAAGQKRVTAIRREAVETQCHKWRAAGSGEGDWARTIRTCGWDGWKGEGVGDGGIKGDVSSGLWGFRDMLFAVPEKAGHTCWPLIQD